MAGPATYISPPSDGPTIVATWNVDEFSATALPKISRGTRFGVIACDVGIANARAAPNSISTRNTGQTAVRPYTVKPSSSAAQTTSDDIARRENRFSIVAVRDLSGRQHQHDERQELREPDQAEIERILGDRIHLPAHRDALHLYRERGDEPRDEIQREVAMLQRTQNRRDAPLTGAVFRCGVASSVRSLVEPEGRRWYRIEWTLPKAPS